MPTNIFVVTLACSPANKNTTAKKKLLPIHHSRSSQNDRYTYAAVKTNSQNARQRESRKFYEGLVINLAEKRFFKNAAAYQQQTWQSHERSKLQENTEKL